MKYTKYTSKTIAVLLVTSILAAQPYSIAHAEEDLDSQLNSVQSQMDSQSANKAEAESRITSFSEQLRLVVNELNAAVAELRGIEAERVRTEEKIVQVEKELKQAQARLDSRMVVLRTRVKDIYINGRLSYLDVILGAKNFNDFANRVELLKRIIDADLDLINSIKAERSIIENNKAVLEQEHQRILALQKEAEAKKAEIEKKRDERKVLLQKAETDRATAMEAYAELQASSNEIKRQLQEREAARKAAAAAAAASGGGGGDNYVKGTGQFSYPVNGPITSGFGYRTHPIFGRVIAHAGVDFGVDEGTVVHAADSGTVVEADWIGGYGYAVIIDHGNGFSTLYGHNSQLIVSAGQTVTRGQPIAYSGSTGNSTGPHVHFEIRVNGEPVDPMGYL